jgi:Family of unknown function (DUF5709)
MPDRDYDTVFEDDGVVEPSDALDSDDLRSERLDTGIDAGEGYLGATRFGTTWSEERTGESLDQLLAEEESDLSADGEWTDEDEPEDVDRPPLRRTGRLLAPDDGAHRDLETDLVAAEVGVDGGGASAEEAAMHITDDPPFHGPIE